MGQSCCLPCGALGKKPPPPAKAQEQSWRPEADVTVTTAKQAIAAEVARDTYIPTPPKVESPKTVKIPQRVEAAERPRNDLPSETAPLLGNSSYADRQLESRLTRSGSPKSPKRAPEEPVRQSFSPRAVSGGTSPSARRVHRDEEPESAPSAVLAARLLAPCSEPAEQGVVDDKVLNLMQRYPDKSRYEVEEALAKANGHAGLVARTFNKQKKSVRPQRDEDGEA